MSKASGHLLPQVVMPKYQSSEPKARCPDLDGDSGMGPEKQLSFMLYSLTC